MSRTINARITSRLAQKLVESCARRGVQRSEVVRVLDQRLDTAAGRVSGYALAADLIPEEGAQTIQSARARELARKALRSTALSPVDRILSSA